MPRTVQIRDNANFDLTIPDELKEVYTDGMVQLLVGVPMCKILFYSVSSAGDFAPGINHGAAPVEHRNAVLQVAIPLNALIELAKSVLSGVTTNNALLADGHAKILTTFNGHIETSSGLNAATPIASNAP